MRIDSGIKTLVGDPLLVEKRREQIVRAAIHQFSIRGYHSTTVRDIANEAGVSPGLIYQYVQDKHDILFLAIMHVVDQNKQEIPTALLSSTDPVERFVRVVEAYTRVNDANRQAVLLTYRETQSLSSSYKETVKRMEIETNNLIGLAIQECTNRGFFRPVNVELVTYNVVTMAHSWATKYWRFRHITTLDAYIQANTDLLLTSLLTKEGRKTYKRFLSREAAAAVED
jgi:AcrR family transcriptional regulator